MIHIHYLKAFKDNYIWLIQNSQDIVVVDPGEDQSVLNYIIENRLNLKGILLTHSHHDHIGGVGQIIKKFQVPIYGHFDLATIKVNDNDNFKLLNCDIKVIHNPGHTTDGVSYLLKDGINEHLFCGDTLFAAGCGRVFTEDYVAMLASLHKLASLNPMTNIYPGHEYTLRNLEFAKLIEPDNMDVQNRINYEQNKMDSFGITLPTTLKRELETNPFLRLNDKSLQLAIKQSAKIDITNSLDYFITLRKLRNNF